MIIIPLLFCALSGIMWKIIPTYIPYLYFQREAFLVFLLALAVLSTRFLSISTHKVEIFKLGGFILFLASFILSLKPFYLIWEKYPQNFNRMLIRSYKWEDALVESAKTFLVHIQENSWHFGTWFLVLLLISATIYHSWRPLGLAPLR